MIEPLPPLSRVVQTCHACPSQWNAWDADGRFYYLRFRCGHGSVETAAGPRDYVDPETPNTLVAEFTHGDRWSGELTLDEFLALAGMALSAGAEVVPR